MGPLFGYYPNASKTYLVVKPEHEDTAREAFADTDVNITTQGKRHLGAALGSKTSTEECVSQKVQEWTRQILKLSEVAIFQPHAAYAAYVHGLSYRWSYLIRTISDIEDLLQPLENAIHQHFIPALTGRPPYSSSERDLLALPARLGGLSIRDPSDAAAECFRSSERITAPLVALIITQDIDETVDSDTSVAIKNEIKKQGMMSKLVLYMTNSPLSSSDALISQKRKALQHGCVFSLLRSMASTYTKGNSEMLYVCGTGGK